MKHYGLFELDGALVIDVYDASTRTAHCHDVHADPQVLLRSARILCASDPAEKRFPEGIRTHVSRNGLCLGCAHGAHDGVCRQTNGSQPCRCHLATVTRISTQQHLPV
jgi:hypothetical protein